MLSVIAGAKRAQKDEAGQAQRLTRLHASLEAAAKEVEARLQKAIQDGIAARDAEGVQKEMRHEIGILKRRIMDVCTSTLQEETVLQRKQLHEKEMFWKLKLETNRVAATAQLRNETRKLEANHETSLRQRLLEQREQLLSGSDGGLRDALQRLDEADEQIHELKRTIAALKHDLKAASVEQLEAAEQAIEARRHNEELQAEAQEEARRCPSGEVFEGARGSRGRQERGGRAAHRHVGATDEGRGDAGQSRGGGERTRRRIRRARRVPRRVPRRQSSARGVSDGARSRNS